MPEKENFLKNLQIKAISPPSALQPYIDNYYVYGNSADSPRETFFRALPNGRVELFFLFNGSKIVCQDKKNKQSLSAFLAGIFELTYPMKIKIETNERKFRGISILFTHMGVNQLLGIKLHEVTNRLIDLHSLKDRKLYSQYESISEIEEEKLRFENINAFFLNQLNNKTNQNQRIIPVLNHLEKMRGLLSVERLASELRISYKSLYRMFIDEMGMSPKMYLKIIRFNRACSLLDYGSKPDITEIIYQCGYYDQSHLVREFKSIMKASPKHYLHSHRGKFYFNRAYAII
ncbi:MAG: helix-turn-helix domain-containing protein [Bacteroidales bacterium]